MLFLIFTLLFPISSSTLISSKKLGVGCVQGNQCREFPSYCCPEGYCCHFWTDARPGIEGHLSSRCAPLSKINDEYKLCDQTIIVPSHKGLDLDEPVEKRKCTEFDKMMGYYCIDGARAKRESVTGDPFMWMQQEMGIQQKMVLDTMLEKNKRKG